MNGYPIPLGEFQNLTHESFVRSIACSPTITVAEVESVLREDGQARLLAKTKELAKKGVPKRDRSDMTINEDTDEFIVNTLLSE